MSEVCDVCDNCKHFQEWVDGKLFIKCEKYGVVEAYEAQDCKDYVFYDWEDE